MTRLPLLLAAPALFAVPANATQPRWPMGRLVEVDVRVGDRDTPLYPARDGSGRLYFEASQGAAYDIVLRNRRGERVGVVLVVDGLNVVSGERAEAHSPRNRMYVLDPWAETCVRGWRTSLSQVRRFTFVDERASYAARSGKANAKMGWVEVGVFRERRSYHEQLGPVYPGGAWKSARTRETATSTGPRRRRPRPSLRRRATRRKPRGRNSTRSATRALPARTRARAGDSRPTTRRRSSSSTRCPCQPSSRPCATNTPRPCAPWACCPSPGGAATGCASASARRTPALPHRPPGSGAQFPGAVTNSRPSAFAWAFRVATASSRSCHSAA